MFGKRPYFLKNKDWYHKTKLGDTDTFKLTRLGMSIPKVLKSYLDYYRIKQEDVFDYATDFDVKTEFDMWAKDGISKRMKASGAADSEINEAVDLYTNIEDIVKNGKNDKT